MSAKNYPTPQILQKYQQFFEFAKRMHPYLLDKDLSLIARRLMKLDSDTYAQTRAHTNGKACKPKKG